MTAFEPGRASMGLALGVATSIFAPEPVGSPRFT
jgi:hypothetical protein